MKTLLVFCILFASLLAQSQVPQRPSPPKLYNNLSTQQPDFLDATEAQALEEKLESFSNETSNQIAVVVVDDLNGLDASDFAFKVGNEWGVGKEGFNNGVVILIKPTGGEGQRDLFIATGYGLEGAIPDLVTKRIREDEMYPYLRAGLNYEALDGATDVLMKLAKGEINQKDYAPQAENNNHLVIPILLVIVFGYLLRWFIRRKGWSYDFGGTTLSSEGSSRSRTSIGFGGYGGGSFGGGGSGGKW